MANIIKLSFLFSFLSASLLFCAGFYYNDLGCDGGWYSYPALAISKNGSPVEDLKQVDDLERVHGVNAVFPFNTYNSIRVFYSALWFRFLPKNIVSLKLLSLLELFLLLFLAYVLIHRFSGDHLTSLLVFAVLLNDKRLLSISASDFRPDIMVAAFSCLAFLLFLRQNRIYGFIFSAVASVLLILVHITAVIPFICIISFFLFHNALCGKFRLKDNYRYLLVAVLVLVVFFCKSMIFDLLLYSSDHATVLPATADYTIINQNTTAVHKISNAFEQGSLFLIKKEISRWKDYFTLINLPELLALFTGLFLLLRTSRFSVSRDKKGFSLILSIVAGLFAFAVFDPHFTHFHGISVIPFLFLMLSHAFHPKRLPSKNYVYLLVTLVWLSSLFSIAKAGQLYMEGKRGGYNIFNAMNCFEETINRNDKTYLILGPTEIWPFIGEHRNVFILDQRILRTVNEKNKKITQKILYSVDYIVINTDYKKWKWEEAFLEHFPTYYFDTKCDIGGHLVLLKISELKKMSR